MPDEAKAAEKDGDSKKVDRYDWEKIGSRGDHRWLPIDDLRVDHAYQRGVLSDATVLNIARSFSWDAFGIVTVAERDNGSFWILDGQQRVEAARRRGDVKRIPCAVFKSTGRTWEARIFRMLNLNRAPVRALEKFRSAVIAGIEPDKSIQKWLDSEGIRVCKTASQGSREFDFIDSLRKAWLSDVSAAKSAMLTQFAVVGEERTNNGIFTGIWYCEHNGVAVAPHVSKIREQGGRAFILGYIKKTVIEYGVGQGSPKTCGIGVLRAINWHRQSKIRFRNVEHEDGAKNVEAE